MRLPAIFDQHLGRHGHHQGFSWGWIAAIWLAHILTESNHRKQPVQAWVRQAQASIEKITGQQVRELDFTDDRLTLLLRRLSKPATWHTIEKELGQSIIRVYELKPERVRLDTTTISGYHEGGEDSLFRYGYSKDDPTLKQVEAMVAALDPLGMPLASIRCPRSPRKTCARSSLHHTHTLTIRGSSHRQRQRRKEDPSPTTPLSTTNET